jgi:hypothetical protein
MIMTTFLLSTSRAGCNLAASNLCRKYQNKTPHRQYKWRLKKNRNSIVREHFWAVAVIRRWDGDVLAYGGEQFPVQKAAVAPSQM